MLLHISNIYSFFNFNAEQKKSCCVLWFNRANHSKEKNPCNFMKYARVFCTWVKYSRQTKNASRNLCEFRNRRMIYSLVFSFLPLQFLLYFAHKYISWENLKLIKNLNSNRISKQNLTVDFHFQELISVIFICFFLFVFFWSSKIQK